MALKQERARSFDTEDDAECEVGCCMVAASLESFIVYPFIQKEPGGEVSR